MSISIIIKWYPLPKFGTPYQVLKYNRNFKHVNN